MGPRAGLDAVQKGEVFAPTGIESLFVQLIA
jgi:hypothetical protein